MPLTTFLIVVLLIFLIGGAVPWGYPGNPAPQPGQPAPPAPGYWHGYGFGPAVPGGIGLIVLVLVALLLIGRI